MFFFSSSCCCSVKPLFLLKNAKIFRTLIMSSSNRSSDDEFDANIIQISLQIHFPRLFDFKVNILLQLNARIEQPELTHIPEFLSYRPVIKLLERLEQLGQDLIVNHSLALKMRLHRCDFRLFETAAVSRLCQVATFRSPDLPCAQRSYQLI